MLQALFFQALNQFYVIPHLTQPPHPHASSSYDHLFSIQDVRKLGYERKRQEV